MPVDAAPTPEPYPGPSSVKTAAFEGAGSVGSQDAKDPPLAAPEGIRDGFFPAAADTPVTPKEEESTEQPAPVARKLPV